jgi:hypothetical protein
MMMMARLVVSTLTAVRNSYLVILHHSTKPTGTQVQSIVDKAVKNTRSLELAKLRYL